MQKKTLAIYGTVVTVCTSKLNFPYFYSLFKKTPNFFPCILPQPHAHSDTHIVPVLTKPLLLTTRLLIQQHIATDSDVGSLSDPEGAAVATSSIALNKWCEDRYIRQVNSHAGKLRGVSITTQFTVVVQLFFSVPTDLTSALTSGVCDVTTRSCKLNCHNRRYKLLSLPQQLDLLAASVVQRQRAGLWYPSSRVQTRPKQSDFSGRKNPQRAFLRRESKAVGPMSQIYGM